MPKAGYAYAQRPMPNDRETNIPKLRQANKPDRYRDAAPGLDN
ncbi:MAG: hypothetical protein V7L21_29535 [Nostoc sp.]|nr:hypothetical protein [Nostoc sp. NMS9]